MFRPARKIYFDTGRVFDSEHTTITRALTWMMPTAANVNASRGPERPKRASSRFITGGNSPQSPPLTVGSVGVDVEVGPAPQGRLSR